MVLGEAEVTIISDGTLPLGPPKGTFVGVPDEERGQIVKAFIVLNANASVIDTARKLGKLFGIPKNLVRQSRQAFYPSVIIGHDKDALIKRLDALLELSLRQQ